MELRKIFIIVILLLTLPFVLYYCIPWERWNLDLYIFLSKMAVHLIFPAIATFIGAMAVYMIRVRGDVSTLDNSINYETGLIFYNKKDYYDAAFTWKILAKRGYAKAQNSLGSMYSKGLGVREDHNEALKWYSLAAKQEHATAQYNIGVIYEQGRGVDKKPEEAVKWYLKAAEQGQAGAQYNLGVLYNEGLDVPQNFENAFKWFCKSARQGIAEGQYNLGTMYYYGNGIQQRNIRKAYIWIRIAMDNNSTKGGALLKVIEAEIASASDIGEMEELVKWSKESEYQNIECDCSKDILQ